MKHYLTKKITAFVSLSLLVASNLMPGVALAAGGSISLTANKGTVAAGGSVIIAVYMNGGGNAVNAVQADLSYPASKLQYVGFSATGSAFEIGATSGGGDGLATLARGTVSAVSGSGLVGTVTFKALAATGSASIGVAGSSSLVSDGNAVPYTSSGVSFNFGATAAAPTTKAAPAAPEPPRDTAAPIISEVKVKQLTPFSATIAWTTNEASDSAIDYGLDTNYGLSSSASPPVTAHSVTLSSAFLSPQTLIHYRVKSVDGAGNVATDTDKTLQLPGVSVTVIVRGADGKPQAGASVTLDGATGTTDSAGKVVLPSSLGNKKIITTFDGVTVQKPITVAKTATPLPPYQLDLAKKPLNHWMLTSAGLAVVVLTLLGIDAVLFGSRLLARLAGIHLLPHGLHRGLGHAAVGPAVTSLASPLANVAAPSAPPKPVEQVVDEMLAVTPAPVSAAPVTPQSAPAPVPAPASAPKPAVLSTPINSINDIHLAQASPSKPSLPTAPEVRSIIVKHEAAPVSAPVLPPSQDIASRLKKKPKAPTHKAKTASKSAHKSTK